MNDDISFDGIDPAVLVHGLYHGTAVLGGGRLHDRPRYSVDDARADLAGPQHAGKTAIYFDYLHGRPFKMRVDLEKKTISTRGYDRDAGFGRAQAVIETLRYESKS